ncbi:putative ABC transport system ATP-binding protein [Hamadaea flava]|uniref:ABC transporter ATP-binding protein n=1 Tax=Hamadaea flava TaxID=1742688 RepID=A0ABV8LYL5_9ACTN|nr:ABC transporter ATP-binding protein [Hamadaea flava]MCP2323499.1 putative ABC transport system ATP-binding protein [Hamadaea flava]
MSRVGALDTNCGDQPGAAAQVLTAHRLFRFYRAAGEEIFALVGVSLSVDAGELVAVAGPSGSGKSTLLALLGGLDEPDGGSVVVDGLVISHRPETERAAIRARSVGILFQYGNLLDHLTVGQNMRLAARLSGTTVAPPDVSGRLAQVGMAGTENMLPRQLSGGQAARAGLAVALVNDPPVVLADEPTAELDSGSERQVLGLLRLAADGGTAVVIASHSPRVLAVCDRVVHLADGQISRIDQLGEVR